MSWTAFFRRGETLRAAVDAANANPDDIAAQATRATRATHDTPDEPGTTESFVDRIKAVLAA